MPITNVTPKTNSSSKDSAVNRSTFRPPWVREDGAETVKPSQWRRPSATAATPAAPTAADTTTKTSEVADKKAPVTTPALKKTTVKTQASAQKPNENGQDKPKEVSAKLQSREIKVPIMTERKKPEPPAPTTTVKKETKPPVVEKPPKVEEEIVPKLLKSSLKPIEKISTIDKIPLQREMSTDKKFIRPVLRKTPKVEESFKEIEKVKAPTVVLKRTEPIKKDPVKKPEIEPVQLQRAVLNKKEPEPELPKRKLEPVKHSFSKKAMPVLEAEDDEEEEEEEVEEEEETETESEESDEESTDEDTPNTSTPAKPEVKAVPEKSVKENIPKSDSKFTPPPPPPPPPSKDGAPPPPPPPPGVTPPAEFEKKPITKKHKEYLEKLKIRPRRRPDWSEMMKEVESGRKLRHVQCNDRSNPILTSKSMTKVKGEFIYETEKATKHNQLLQSIQIGVRLRPTKTNDRSKPILEGLRKFRRQMTVEEQVLKSESRAVLNTEATELEAPTVDSPDEMDDIDKLRDDLQSTKQLLAIELRNREAQDRENKRLQQRVQNLEAELAREKWVVPIASQPETQNKPAATADESLVESLKQEAKLAQSTAQLLEKKFHDTAEHLDKAKNEVEEQKRQIALLEKKLAQAMQGISGFDANRRQSESHQKDSSPEPEPEVSESEEDESEEKKAERRARRVARDVRVLTSQLSRFKDKKKAAKREREMLRSAMKKNHVILKQEKKKFKKIQREVDKISAMMKEEEDEDDENAEPKEEKEPEEEANEGAESEDEESESSEEESENESGNEASESEPEDAPDDKKKDNLEPRVKRHEGRLTALKKGNFMLQANVERLLDEINKTRENSVTLQNDLDSILCELG